MTARSSGARAARLRSRLSERDIAVLESLFRLRLMRTDQVQRLHVSEGSPATQARRSRALLARLHELGVVTRMERSVGGIRAGSSGHVYGLTGLGLAVLEMNGRYGARRRTIWTTKPAFAEHVLAVAELAVQLAEHARQRAVELLTFDGEPKCWRRFMAGGGVPATLKPDAFVRVGVGEYEHSVFVEMDMGTERAPTLKRKLQAFADYWRSGVEQQATGVFPLVVWLVPDEHRSNKIQEVIQQMTNETHQLFRVALQHDGAAMLAPSGEEV